MIDLRSDTVTRPTPAMRAAMATAEVGDDVYGEDPTVNRLEKEAAAAFGREAAIFVPTGTMGNQIAIRLHTQHGQEVICEARSHILDWEMAMTAAFAGCQARTVAADRGILTWAHVKQAIGPKIYYRAQTGLICLENTHNMAGGTVTPLAILQEVWDGAHDAGLPVHLDGARVFNAALIALKEMPARLVEDHANARLLAEAIAAEPTAEIDLDAVQTNIVIFKLRDNTDASAFCVALKEKGVLASAVGPHSVRFVTHYDVDKAACAKAASIVSERLRLL